MSLAGKLLTGILCLLLCSPLKVSGWDWQTRVTVVVKDQPLKAVCEILEKEYGIHFSYSRELVDLSRKVTVTAYQQRLKSLLEQLFAPEDIRFTRVGDQLVLQQVKRSTRTISGYVQDAVSGEKLPGATIYAPTLKQGTTTNQYGFFSLTTVKDTNSLIVSYVGYEPALLPVEGQANRILLVPLQPLASLQEVVVSATDKTKLQDQTQMSRVHLPLAVVQSMPKLLGEADVMRTLQSMPGVGGGMDGAGGLHVRGGSPDQNLILMDGTPVFNFSHFFGVYSLLNAEVVKSADLYKGAFPARFGGRLSSVVDISLKDGDMRHYHGDVAIGMISAKFNVEGPIIKDKTSFIVSARRSYPDLLYNATLRTDGDFGRGGALLAYFYDVNAKINHIFSAKDRIYLSLYKGEDNLRIKSVPDTALPDAAGRVTESSRFQLGWGNTIGGLRWNHIYSTRLFSNVSLNYSQYAFRTEYNFKSKMPATGQASDLYGKYFSRMKNLGLKVDFDFRPSPNHSFRFGTAVTAHYFKPGLMDMSDKGAIPVVPLDTGKNGLDIRGTEMLLYLEDDWRLTENLYANLGVHTSGFLVEGRFYHSLQPRVGLRYMLPRNWAVKASYTHMNQYIHLLSSAGTSLPTDVWVPSTQRVAPMYSRQVAAGIAKTSMNNAFEFTLEGYYKTMYNMIEYSNNNTAITENLERWDENVVIGKGWSYGGEAMIKKQKGSTTGWIGYTLAWSTRQFPDINRGRIFPYKYDHRHDVEIVLTQRIGKRWEASASWHYTTGAPLTLPVSSYQGVGTPSPWDPGNGGDVALDRYDGRYNYRAADVHRLDVGITYSKQKKRWRKSWNLSVYNVYNQKNPFLYYMKRDEEEKQRYLSKVTVMPILPSITYSIKF
ncbi:Outer membrane receptor proteins, mostly Fe transport [Chitinophaga eiseniae]|uniref:Outer membrane receptor proteins, mostly Fe transport n=1 Tax=Chitinophaga eiseniae TaxID=634771 RepID=A0A1T4QMF1_9BACT|nr:Outer membrane receptor proteins, mostly Fe transport [Chitinophaga eiseniae]